MFTKLELYILQDALIAYKYQSHCPKNKIKTIQKKLLSIESNITECNKLSQQYYNLLLYKYQALVKSQTV